MHKVSYNHNHVLNNDSFTGCCLDCDRSFAIIKTHILDFYEEIKDYTYSSLSSLPVEELYRKYQLLDDITKLSGGDNLSRMILNDAAVKNVLPCIREFYTFFFEIHEKYLANKILHSSTPWTILDNFELFPRYRGLINNQIELLSLKRKERVIFIGCGPLPVSLIVLKKYFNIDSVGIDSDPDAVKLANGCLKKLGLHEDINIVHGDESITENINGDRVVIAAMAIPKKRIFNNLRLLIEKKKNLKIIYRTYSGLRALLYPPISSDDTQGFVKINEIKHSGEINNSLVLLAPKKLLLFDEAKKSLIEIYDRIKRFSDIKIMQNIPKTLDLSNITEKKEADFTRQNRKQKYLRYSSDSIREQFNKLDYLAAVPVDNSFAEKLENDPGLKSTLKGISRFRKFYNIKLELERADLILSSNVPWKTVEKFSFYKNYLKLAEMEVEGAKLCKGNHIIFLGSGPLPLSLIILCRQYGMTGTGIEQNSEYAGISKQVISKLNLSEKINILHGSHFELPLQKKTQLIMIAAAAVPKQEIFAHLGRVLKKGTKVSYRIYEKGLRRFLDVDSERLNNDLEKMRGRFKEYKRIIPEPPVNNTCVFMK
jgi:precorrin-6B methylase 2